MENCILCGSNKPYKLGKKLKYDILICQECTLTKLHPTPSEIELEEFYKNEYREKYSNQKLVDQGVLKNEQRRANHIVPFFENETKTFSNFLDIGCSTGVLINSLKKKLKIDKATGLELNTIYAEYAKKNTDADIIKNSLESVTFSKKFDLITMVHVLEHMSNPKKVLEKISKIIQFGGLLYIEVPNLKTPYLDLFKDYFQIYHTYYFTDNTLRILIEQNGFKLINIQYINKHSVGIIAQKSNDIQCDHVTFDNYKDLLTRLRNYTWKYKIKSTLKKLLGKY